MPLTEGSKLQVRVLPETFLFAETFLKDHEDTYESAKGAIVWNKGAHRREYRRCDCMEHAPACTIGQVLLLVSYIDDNEAIKVSYD